MRRLLLVLIAMLATAPAAQAWSWPADGPVLAPFSFDPANPYAAGQHRGLDIGGAASAPVRAPASGTVSFAGTVPGSGKSMTIETADGWSVTLTHLGQLGIKKDAVVAEGDAVGALADGSSDPPYVQLGIRRAADAQGYVDPLGLLPARSAPAPAAPPLPSPAPAASAAPAPADLAPAPRGEPAPAPAAVATAEAPVPAVASAPASAPAPLEARPAPPFVAAAAAAAPEVTRLRRRSRRSRRRPRRLHRHPSRSRRRRRFRSQRRRLHRHPSRSRRRRPFRSRRRLPFRSSAALPLPRVFPCRLRRAGLLLRGPLRRRAAVPPRPASSSRPRPIRLGRPMRVRARSRSRSHWRRRRRARASGCLSRRRRPFREPPSSFPGRRTPTCRCSPRRRC